MRFHEKVETNGQPKPLPETKSRALKARSTKISNYVPKLEQLRRCSVLGAKMGPENKRQQKHDSELDPFFYTLGFDSFVAASAPEARYAITCNGTVQLHKTASRQFQALVGGAYLSER
jgi:hypothetical protein